MGAPDETARQSSEQATTVSADRAALRTALRNRCMGMFGVRIKDDEPLFLRDGTQVSLGEYVLDSIDLVEILMALEDELGIGMEEADVEVLVDPDSLVDMITKLASSSALDSFCTRWRAPADD